jgi:hypothetical protein
MLNELIEGSLAHFYCLEFSVTSMTCSVPGEFLGGPAKGNSIGLLTKSPYPSTALFSNSVFKETAGL